MGIVGHMSNVIVGIDADSSLTRVDWRRKIPDAIKGDLLVARRVCRVDTEGGPSCAIFTESSSSPKTAPAFAGLHQA